MKLVIVCMDNFYKNIDFYIKYYTIMEYLMRYRESIDSNKKKYFQQYNKDNFTMFYIWTKEFYNTYKKAFNYLEESIQNYYEILDLNFFDWLNNDKNKFKFMFEIKKEFMAIAEDVLLHVLLKNQLKKTENYFVVGLFQEYLEFVSREDSDITLDIYDNNDIDSRPDIEPSYHLLEENNVSVVLEVEECDDKSYIDDKFYQSFFI